MNTINFLPYREINYRQKAGLFLLVISCLIAINIIGHLPLLVMRKFVHHNDALLLQQAIKSEEKKASLLKEKLEEQKIDLQNFQQQEKNRSFINSETKYLNLITNLGIASHIKFISLNFADNTFQLYGKTFKKNFLASFQKQLLANEAISTIQKIDIDPTRKIFFHLAIKFRHIS